MEEIKSDVSRPEKEKQWGEGERKKERGGSFNQ